MPVFEYAAISPGGKPTKGSIDAENVRAARQRLRSQGIYPTTIKESEITPAVQTRDIRRLFQADRVSTAELAIATRQACTLVSAGLPLVSALQALADQTAAPVLKRIIIRVRESVEQGSSLARALGEFPRAFPRLYVNLVAAGEASGTLDTVLSKLADYLESQMELRRKVTAALAYPAIMLFICCAVIVALLTFVVPRIVQIFERQNIALPLPTRIVLGTSNLLTNYWYIFALLIVAGILSLRYYYRQPKGRETIDRLLLKIPIFGPIYLKVCTARVMSTLGTLITSGVELLTALDITRNIVGNVHVVSALERARDGVREGRSLAAEFGRSSIFPTMVCHMVAVGEKSGDLENMLMRVAAAYESEVNATLSGLTSLLEPLMMVVVGGIVFFIVISVLLPMTEMIAKVR